MLPAGRAEWARLSAWAERTLQEQALGLFHDYCAAAGDLASARTTWSALGCPMFMERVVGPHVGLAAHPALAVIDGLTRQKLRLAAAINLLPPRIAAQPQQPPVVDDAGSGAVGFDDASAARFFN